MAKDEPRIIVDTDWKEEARREKEQLAAEAEHTRSAHGPLPEPTFLEIVNMIAMQAMIGLGGMKMPDGRQLAPDHALAKHHIDLLEVLQHKTDGQLDDNEKRVLDTTLHELRLGFVQVVSGNLGAAADEDK